MRPQSIAKFCTIHTGDSWQGLGVSGSREIRPFDRSTLCGCGIGKRVFPLLLHGGHVMGALG